MDILNQVVSYVGGHLTSAYEQKTQQSPSFGLIVSPQLMHLKKCRQALTGISAFWVKLHFGQVKLAIVVIYFLSNEL